MDGHIAEHGFGGNHQTRHHSSHLPQHEVERDGAIGQEHPLGGAVADAPFMPNSCPRGVFAKAAVA